MQMTVFIEQPLVFLESANCARIILKANFRTESGLQSFSETLTCVQNIGVILSLKDDI